jgi:hypothetical protein
MKCSFNCKEREKKKKEGKKNLKYKLCLAKHVSGMISQEFAQLHLNGTPTPDNCGILDGSAHNLRSREDPRKMSNQPYKRTSEKNIINAP